MFVFVSLEGLQRSAAIHALTSPELQGRGSEVLLSLYLCVFVKDKDLLAAQGLSASPLKSR